jgi:hypothetical protein
METLAAIYWKNRLHFVFYAMRAFLMLLLMTIGLHSFGQYPFERYPAIKYKEYANWKEIKRMGKNNHDTVEYILSIPKFFNKKDNLTIRLAQEGWDSSDISLFRNGRLIQHFFEPMTFHTYYGFQHVFAPVRVADINGDKTPDCKLLISYEGTGLAILNTRVIYLFQHSDHSFTKISYLDMIDGKDVPANRPERDFNGDGNYEIITMSINGYQNHSYWVYNLYNFKNNTFVSVNSKYDYPILIQFLNRDNYEVTRKMSRQKMKDFAEKRPEDFDERK